MDTKRKIAFGGKMGSGKDTAVDYLVSKYGGKKISFSEPLYDILHYAQNRLHFEIEKDRKFLQFIGTEWARSKDENIWIKLALEKAKDINENVFISDIRFQNELTFLKNDGWFCIKIVRNGLNDDDKEIRKGTGSLEHVSEASIDNIDDTEWDVIIQNDNDLKHFYETIDKKIKMF